jgi:hypothetical protein
LRLYANNNRIIAVAEQLRLGAGTSITNGAEIIATLVFDLCQKEFGLNSHENFQWIEFYPKETNYSWEDDYKLVLFDWNGSEFSNPDWNKKSFDEVKEILGMDPPKSALKNNPYFFTEKERNDLYESLSSALEKEHVPAKYGGHLDLEASEYTLFQQNRDGHYVFGHPDAESLVLLTPDGDIQYPDDEYSHRNY